MDVVRPDVRCRFRLEADRYSRNCNVMAPVSPAGHQTRSDPSLIQCSLERIFEPVLAKRLSTECMVDAQCIANLLQHIVRQPVRGGVPFEVIGQLKLPEHTLNPTEL